MEDDKKENSLVDIRKFLDDSERPLESEEFMEFWRSLIRRREDGVQEDGAPEVVNI